jgi:hypothetical protein
MSHHAEGPREPPEISFRDRGYPSMRRTVRLTRLPGGGFRLEGVAETPIDALPGDTGFMVSGGGSWRLAWNVSERGWLLKRQAGEISEDAGQTTASSLPQVIAPVSVLLEDGRLFRLAATGLSDPIVELTRWDGPGAYVAGRPVGGGWDLETTAAGAALDAPAELWILICAELGRLDGWH